MGRGGLWRRDGRRLWRWPCWGRSSNRPRCSSPWKRHPAVAPPPAPSSLAAAEGTAQCWPGASRSYSTSTRHTQPSWWAGPRGMDLRGAIQTGMISSLSHRKLFRCSLVRPMHVHEHCYCRSETSANVALTLSIFTTGGLYLKWKIMSFMSSSWRITSSKFLKYP